MLIVAPANRPGTPSNRSTHRPRGFTLVELLVVVTIIALLIAIMLPSLRKARESAKRALCQANQRTLGLGFFIYADAYNGVLPSSYALWNAPWGVGEMFWHQRLIEERVAEGKAKPTRSNAVCPSDKKPWTPYTWTTDETLIYNTSYGGNPVALIIDGMKDTAKAAMKGMDGVHDWKFYPYKGRRNCRIDTIRYPAYLILATEVEGPQTPYYFDPWLPNKDEPTQDGEWAWARHDQRFNGKTGGYVNYLHADGSVAHSQVNGAIYGLSDTDNKLKLARKEILPEGQ